MPTNRMSKAKGRSSATSSNKSTRGKRTKGVSKTKRHYNLPSDEKKLKGIVSRSPKKPKGYK